MLQPLIDVMIPFLPGWLELPASYVGLLKSAFHKYIRRVPKAGGGYRYFYHVGHGGGIANADHFVPGASFRFDGGHYHIKSEEGGKLTIEHDETKERKTVSKAELQSMLTAHHEPAIKAHREKVAGMLADARANKASPKQIAKLEAQAKAAGVETSPLLASVPRVPATPKGEVPEKLYWTNTYKHGNPATVGMIFKTNDGHHVVIEEIGGSKYTSASDNEDFHGHYGGATWTHEAKVRPADADEVAHYMRAEAPLRTAQAALDTARVGFESKVDAIPEKAPSEPGGWDIFPYNAVTIAAVPPVPRVSASKAERDAYESAWGRKPPDVTVKRAGGNVYLSRVLGSGNMASRVVDGAPEDSPEGRAILAVADAILDVRKAASDVAAARSIRFVESPRAAAMRAAAKDREAQSETKKETPRNTGGPPPGYVPAQPVVTLPTAMDGLTEAHHAAASRRGLTLVPARGGKSVHIEGNTFAHKDKIKRAGGKWDAEKKSWKIPLDGVNAVLKGFRPSATDPWGKA